ncbi:MAG TPA: MliC family protein [Casimicrobiaceae bacterium]|jgi:membrane-bound inhibitor of C-type lysozyme
MSCPRIIAYAAVTLVLAACQSGPSKEEIDAAKNTIDCTHGDERLVVRFEEGEARMLLGDATRVVLYQVSSASGLRYTNGLMELRGKGLDFTLVREGNATPLTCKPYEIPKKE